MSETVALKAPFPWYGGKRWVADLVWDRFGDVPNYVEPFAGSLAVLLARPHAPRTETVNDADAHLTNFWRAVQADPEAVARYADWPVSELDLHARHLWLVNEGRRRVERLRTDPEHYDAQAAGWWVWGICQWIGSGFCSGKGPLRLPEADGGTGIHRKLPHLGDAGTGIHRKLPHLGDAGRVQSAPGIAQQLPHLGDGGRKRPHLLTAGKGIHAGGVSQQLPYLAGGNGDSLHIQGFRHGATCAERAENLLALMAALSDRLRRVRITCGDWTRVLGPSVTIKHGLTAVFLDPPYALSEREAGLYAVDEDVSGAVREWAIANGDHPLLRICLAGYEGEHAMPATWECVPWKARGGYGSQGTGRARDNSARERLWFNKSCLKPERHTQGSLF